MGYSAFKSTSKMIQEQKTIQGKREKKKSLCVKTWLKRRKKIEFYETLLAELWLEDEYNE